MVPDRPLFRRFGSIERLPHLALGSYPTPVQPIDLSAVAPAFAGHAWVKREDLSAPAVGGNKIRKLEYLLGEARAKDAGTIVTTGGLASNFCLATAFHASNAGLGTHVVLFPQRLTDEGRAKFRAICSLAIVATYCPTPNLSPLLVAAAARRRGATAYAIPAGGSSTTGVLGAVDLGLEIAEQVTSGAMEPPDAVYTATSSAGTAAGVAVGLQIAGLDTRVVAVRVYPPPITSAFWIRRLARRVVRAIERATNERIAPFDASRITVEPGYMGDGYAEPMEAATRAGDIAKDFGLDLDATYTAKAFAAFLDAARGDRRILFLHTYDPRLPDGLGDMLDPDGLPVKLRSFLR